MGCERAIEILQELVDRVVVAVAETAMVELVGPCPETAHAELVIGVADLLHRTRDVVQRHRSARHHAPARLLAHLRAPSVVCARHRSLQLGIDAVEPHVVLGPVDDHDVDAFGLERGRDAIAAEPLQDEIFAVLGDHVVGGPVDRLLEAAVDAREMLRPAAVDRHRVVVVEARRTLAADAFTETPVEEARPEIGRIDHVGIGVEHSQAVTHGRTVRSRE